MMYESNHTPDDLHPEHDFDAEVASTRAGEEITKLLESRSRPTETVPFADVRRMLGL